MIEFDTSGFEKMVDRIKQARKKLKRGKQIWFNYLTSHPSINIQAKLKDKIYKEVYQSSNPVMYQRTGDLLEATRVTIKDDKILMYMDEDWLGSQPQGYKTSREYGFDEEAHDGSGYAWLVEYDHTYKNEGGGHPYKRQGSHYMKKTFDEIVEDVKTGRSKPEKLLEPLFKEWGR